MSTLHLFVMRHGPSEERAPSGRDFDRTLSAKGRLRTLAVARELRRRGERPGRILSSPLVRARETAALVASTFGGADVKLHDVRHVREELAPGGDAHGLVLELTALAATEDDSVLVVSHAPDVSILTETLLGRHVAAFAPATVVAIDLTDGKAARRFVLDPEIIDP